MKEIIEKQSIIDAGYKFRNELKDLQVSDDERRSYLKEFLDAFKRSEDYDLASASIFDRIMQHISRKTNKGIKRTVHLSELDMSMYISIRDQIKDMLFRGKDPEDVANQIAAHYNLFWQDVFHLAFNLANKEVFSRKSKFKSFWKKEVFVDKIFGLSRGEQAVLGVESIAREKLLDNKSESDVAYALIEDARNYFGRELTQNEIDKIRYTVLHVKMKLYNKKDL